MTHIGYILAAYVIAAAVIAGMTAWVVIDLKAQRRKLRRLEAQGVRRRAETAR